MKNTTIFLKDYKAPVFAIEQVDLSFDLHDHETIVENCMLVRRLHPGPLTLFGDELDLLSLRLDGELLAPPQYRSEENTLIIDDCPDACTLLISTRIHPERNTKLSGLYRSNQLFCTQCEAEGFRRITYFPDRPDVLSTFTTRITADKAKYPVLLSNGNLLEKGEAENGRHWVVWQDPFKKPSYLFALVAGNLACVQDSFVTCSGKTVELKIYVEPGNEDKCGHAMASLKKAMRWDEEMYGREYDLSIFMIVAVSDFNMGAMENKGLNIFNSKYILARQDTATDQDFADIEGVVAHEYFHNWTGNRVTCRDWFQLSLKEGLTVFRDQEFSRDMNSPAVNRIQDVKALRIAQFPEDKGSIAHPVRPSSYQEINNFYTATIYNKGAEVIRMQQTILGKEGFRRGMDCYFERHDGQAVTIDDFVAAMEAANGVDLSQMAHWYNQAGTPEVSVEETFEKGSLKLLFQQFCPATPECQEKKPFCIPIKVAFFDKDGHELQMGQDHILLTEKEQTFTFSGFKEKPLVSLLRDFSAPIKLTYPQSHNEQLALLRFETDGFAKWDTAQRLVLHYLSSAIEAKKPYQNVPSLLIETFKHILLDKALDEALKAELLNPPSFEEVVADLSAVDVMLVEAVRDHYRSELGRLLFDQWQDLYQYLLKQENNERHAKAYGQRRLRNLCLWFMMKGDEQRALAKCEEQFIKRINMTDQLASFSLLANCQIVAYRERAIDQFYEQWTKDELVLDKWFAIQASAEAGDCLTKVNMLLNHPAFSLTNPNKVRALIGVFCQNNPRHFHAPDGSGYTFLTTILLQLDKINPQIAARLATPFTRWSRYNSHHQGLIKEQLQYLRKHDLSRDLQELVVKSLQ